MNDLNTHRHHLEMSRQLAGLTPQKKPLLLQGTGDDCCQGV